LERPDNEDVSLMDINNKQEPANTRVSHKEVVFEIVWIVLRLFPFISVADGYKEVQ
ncbi:hypothetical protein XENOCAPTIV_014406, partial [Xenoophorus captivus]